ncbi:MAG TPA: hypothetical protein VLC53_10215 [Myxococcota bacterium]|nr:hypothetical protein [Myxococcota bacterium]
MLRARPLPAFLTLACLLASPAAFAAEAKRFGAEGMLLGYDEARNVFKVKITSPKVSGGFGSGGIAGKPAPGLKSGDELELEVVPEGSVLKRTVIKASKGGGLDNSGTREGFKTAVAAIPTDRAVVLSFEPKPAGEPKYLLKMVQIRMSPEEVQKRLRELGLSDEDIQEAERAGAGSGDSAN